MLGRPGPSAVLAADDQAATNSAFRACAAHCAWGKATSGSTARAGITLHAPDLRARTPGPRRFVCTFHSSACRHCVCARARAAHFTIEAHQKQLQPTHQALTWCEHGADASAATAHSSSAVDIAQQRAPSSRSAKSSGPAREQTFADRTLYKVETLLAAAVLPTCFGSCGTMRLRCSSSAAPSLAGPTWTPECRGPTRDRRIISVRRRAGCCALQRRVRSTHPRSRRAAPLANRGPAAQRRRTRRTRGRDACARPLTGTFASARCGSNSGPGFSRRIVARPFWLVSRSPCRTPRSDGTTPTHYASVPQCSAGSGGALHRCWWARQHAAKS